MSLHLNIYHKDQFRRASLSIPITFTLQLAEHGKPLVLKKCLRIIDGKRIVALAEWEGHEVVAKLFFKKGHAKRNLRKELEGFEALVEASLPAPKLLLHDVCKHDTDIKIILLEKLEDAQGFGEFVGSDEVVQDQFYGQLFELIARMHNHGILQRDFHLDNFLISNEKLYIIDTAEFEVTSLAVRRSKSCYNLVKLFSQLKITNPRMQKSWYAMYAAWRDWEYKEEFTFKLFKQFSKQHLKRFNAKLKRMKNRSKRQIECSSKREMIVVRDYFDDAVIRAIKDITGEVSVLVNTQRFFVTYFAEAKQAIKTWESIHWLQFNGVPSVTPVAVVVSKIKPHYHYVVWLGNDGQRTKVDSFAATAAISADIQQI